MRRCIRVKIFAGIDVILIGLCLNTQKYTPNFASSNWREMIMLSDEDLTNKGVAALGARRKLLKVSEVGLFGTS